MSPYFTARPFSKRNQRINEVAGRQLLPRQTTSTTTTNPITATDANALTIVTSSSSSFASSLASTPLTTLPLITIATTSTTQTTSDAPTQVLPPPTTTSTQSSQATGTTVIAACVSAAIILIVTIVLTIIFVKRKRRSRNVTAETRSTVFDVRENGTNGEGQARRWFWSSWSSRTVDPLLEPPRERGQQSLFGQSARNQSTATVQVTRRKKIPELIQPTQQVLEQISQHGSNTVTAQTGGGQTAEMEQQVASLQEQVQQMRGQMEHLQRQLHSDRAMSLTDEGREGPPAYV